MSDRYERCAHNERPSQCLYCKDDEIERLRRELADCRGAVAIMANTENDHSPTCECRICRMASELAEARRLQQLAQDQSESIGNQYAEAMAEWARSLAEAQAKIAELRQALAEEMADDINVKLAEARGLLRRALDSGGGSSYEEEAEFGIRCCCSVRDYREHKPDCWVAAIDAFLGEESSAGQSSLVTVVRE